MTRRFAFLVRRALLGAAASSGALALGQGCELDPHACRRSHTCQPVEEASGGTSDLEGLAGSGGVPFGGSTGSSGEGSGDSGSEGGLGGAPADVGPIQALGDPCALHGQYACAGHAQRVQLICDEGAFVEYGICRASERCDTRPDATGLCQPIVPECTGQNGGAAFCRDDELWVCGGDLVTAEMLGTCPGGCVDGQCTECTPGTPASCQYNSVRTCSEDGAWGLAPCPAEAPLCTGGKCGVPRSCLGLPETCGQGEPCCLSPVVTGGDFVRDNDADLPATISSFRLDRFEVTVARFRRFKADWDEGWRPDNGSGRHVHLNEGHGLVDFSAPGTFEAGWRNEYLAQANPSDTNLQMNDGSTDQFATWTPAAGVNETRPINRATRQEAYAFCIWDGGFLPSDAEWSYASTGGDAQRAYPWGNNPPGNNATLAVYGCLFASPQPCQSYLSIAQVGKTTGAGLFGQLDLLGNVSEWTLGATSEPECIDCTEVNLGALGDLTAQPCRGRAYNDSAQSLLSPTCLDNPHPNGYRTPTVGIRCARLP